MIGDRDKRRIPLSVRGFVMGLDAAVPYEESRVTIREPASFMCTEWVLVPALSIHLQPPSTFLSLLVGGVPDRRERGDYRAAATVAMGHTISAPRSRVFKNREIVS